MHSFNLLVIFLVSIAVAVFSQTSENCPSKTVEECKVLGFNKPALPCRSCDGRLQAMMGEVFHCDCMSCCTDEGGILYEQACMVYHAGSVTGDLAMVAGSAGELKLELMDDENATGASLLLFQSAAAHAAGTPDYTIDITNWSAKEIVKYLVLNVA